MKNTTNDACETRRRFSVPDTLSDYINYKVQLFESECFGNTTLEILDWDCADFSAAVSSLQSELDLAQGDMMYLRLAASDIYPIKDATQAGFFFVESSIVPTIKTRTWDATPFARFIQTMEQPAQHEIALVEDIAASSFSDLRFNLDPYIDNNLADLRYKKWLTNALEAGEDVRVIRHRGTIAGFCLFKHLEDGVTIFRLGAVRDDLKGSGLGFSLYASAVAHCIDKGATQIDGGISMANTPVLNVMATLGFTFKDPTIVLHYHI